MMALLMMELLQILDLGHFAILIYFVRWSILGHRDCDNREQEGSD